MLSTVCSTMPGPFVTQPSGISTEHRHFICRLFSFHVSSFVDTIIKTRWKASRKESWLISSPSWFYNNISGVSKSLYRCRYTIVVLYRIPWFFLQHITRRFESRRWSNWLGSFEQLSPESRTQNIFTSKYKRELHIWLQHIWAMSHSGMPWDNKTWERIKIIYSEARNRVSYCSCRLLKKFYILYTNAYNNSL